MNYALYQYVNCVGTVSHALINIKSKRAYRAMPFPISGRLMWQMCRKKDEPVWESIQNDKHHKIVAIAAHPSFITPRS